MLLLRIDSVIRQAYDAVQLAVSKALSTPATVSKQRSTLLPKTATVEQCRMSLS